MVNIEELKSRVVGRAEKIREIHESIVEVYKLALDLADAVSRINMMRGEIENILKSAEKIIEEYEG